MNSEFAPERIGEQLGHGGVENVTELAGNYAESERRRIEATCQAEIVERKARLFFLQEKEKELKDRLCQAPPLGDVQTRRRRCIYYATIAAILTVSGFFFALLAFDPFQFGWKGYLYCLGVAVVTPFAVDKLLDLWEGDRLLRGLAATAVIAAVASLALLAIIRGESLFQHLQAMDSTVVSGLEDAQQPGERTNFYEQTTLWLRATMALLALAMEIGAGLALHDAWRFWSNSGDDPRQLRAELAAVREEMIVCVKAIALLQNMSEEFLNGFWRDFYRAMLTGTVRKALMRGVLGFFLLSLLSNASTHAEPTLNIVVAIDLSRSLQVRGPDGKTQHERNLGAITKLLSTVPTGSRVTIIAISDRSFAQPYVLVSAQITEDAGYFNERLTAARNQLVRAWTKTADRIQPNFPHTDVFGALLLAGQILGESPKSRKLLVILSDMRHEAFELNLESPDAINANEMLVKADRSGLIASLQRVEIHVVGAVAPGKLPSYWESLRLFWDQYFAKAGAQVRYFGVTRHMPRLDQPQL